jgi:hypothetical protein
MYSGFNVLDMSGCDLILRKHNYFENDFKTWILAGSMVQVVEHLPSK